MASQTKADLIAALVRLNAENVSMRAALEQIRDAGEVEKTAPLAAMDFDNMIRGETRLRNILILARWAADSGLRGSGAYPPLAVELAKPLDYEPFRSNADAAKDVNPPSAREVAMAHKAVAS